MKIMKRILAVLLMSMLILSPAAATVMTPALTAEAASPSLSVKSLTLKEGETKTLKLRYGSAYRWGYTGNGNVTVTKKGNINTVNVKGVKKGNCKVACQLTNGKILYCNVTVTKATQSTSSSSSSSGKGAGSADKKVYNKIIAMKKKYPEGSRYGDEKKYKGYGACQAFAYLMSDTAFGSDAPYYRHYDFGALRVGDIIYQVPGSKLSDGSITNTIHALVVLKVDYGKDELVVCEGNYNGKAHWGSRFSLTEFAFNAGASVTSRYPYSESHSVKVKRPGKATIQYSYSSGIGKFTFKKLKNCTGYQVLFSEDKSFSYKHTQTRYANGTNYIMFHGTEHIWAQNASGGVAYMKVRAINNRNGHISYGKWSSIRKIK